MANHTARQSTAHLAPKAHSGRTSKPSAVDVRFSATRLELDRKLEELELRAELARRVG